MADKDDKQKRVISGAVWFYVIVAISLIALFVFHFWTQNRFADSYDSIMNNHDAFCKSMTLNNKILAKDSVLIVDASMLDAIKAESKAFDSHVELLYSRINDQQTGLTLWASALMIVFLVFSIYSMYKIDEIQKQGHDYITKIHEHHHQSVKQLSDMDKRLNDGQEKIINESNVKLREWKESVDNVKDDTLNKMTSAMNVVAEVSRASGDLQAKLQDFESRINESVRLTGEIKSAVLNFQDESARIFNEFKINCSGLVNELQTDLADKVNAEMDRAITDFREKAVITSSESQTQTPDSTIQSEERYEEAFDSIEQQATPDDCLPENGEQ